MLQSSYCEWSHRPIMRPSLYVHHRPAAAVFKLKAGPPWQCAHVRSRRCTLCLSLALESDSAVRLRLEHPAAALSPNNWKQHFRIGSGALWRLRSPGLPFAAAALGCRSSTRQHGRRRRLSEPAVLFGPVEYFRSLEHLERVSVWGAAVPGRCFLSDRSIFRMGKHLLVASG